MSLLPETDRILVYALYEALAIVEEEGLDARWQRHERNHKVLLASLSALDLTVLPRDGERLWTLNAIRGSGGRRRSGRAQSPEDLGAG